jgi:electron transfer flavoprotein alpha subunit
MIRVYQSNHFLNGCFWKSQLCWNWASSLVFIEHVNGKIHPSVLNTISAARKISQPVHGILATQSEEEMARLEPIVRKLCGLEKIHVGVHPGFAHFLPETLSPWLAECIMKLGCNCLFASNSSVGKNLLPRVAAELDVAPISDIIEVIDLHTFVRPIYAGNQTMLRFSIQIVFDRKCFV